MEQQERNSVKAFALQDKILDSKLSKLHGSSASTDAVSAKLDFARPAESNRVALAWWHLRMLLQPVSVQSSAYEYWNNCILILTIVVVFYTPYRLAFQEVRTNFELAIDIIFLVNMGLHMVHFYSPLTLDKAGSILNRLLGSSTSSHFHSPVENSTTTTRHPRLLILVSYLTQWRFIVDVVASFPWDFIASSAGATDPRLSFGLGMLRLVRVVNVLQAVVKAEKNVRIPYYSLRIFGFLIFISVESHWFACIFYFVGRIGNYDTSWIKALNETKGAGMPSEEMSRYLICLYWALQTSATLGYGDVTPQCLAEYVVIVVFVAVNVFTSAYLIGNITNLLSSSGEETRHFRSKFSQLENFMRLNYLPDDIRETMRSYMQLKFSAAAENRDVLNELPEVFRNRIHRLLYRPVLESSLLGEVTSDGFIDHALHLG